MSTVRLHIVASIAIAWTMGCSGSEHPQPAGDSEGDPAEVRLAEEEALATQGTATCVPFSTRTCRNYYRTADGQLHCPESIEVCREDGKGFGACGDIPSNPSNPGDAAAIR